MDWDGNLIITIMGEIAMFKIISIIIIIVSQVILMSGLKVD